MQDLKTGYFPGCSQTGTAKEYDMSLRKVTEKLGLTLSEIEDWNCCGATSAHVTSHKLANALAMRNIVLAAEQGLEEIVAPCAACYSRLLLSQHETNRNPKTREETEELLEHKIEKTINILNLIEMLQKIGTEKIKNAISNPLKDIKVACYYGCLLVRPADITHFDDAEQPNSMEELVEITGAKTVDWNFKTECCGAGHSMARREIVVDLSKKILDNARSQNADVIVVACPMCHYNLDMRQMVMKKESKEHKEIPVLFLTELIGLAMGVDEHELGIDKHYVKFKYKSAETKEKAAESI